MNQENLLTSIAEQGWYSCIDFIDKDQCRKLIDEMNSLPLKAARIGKGTLEQRYEEIRNDHIYWLDGSHSSAQASYLSKAHELMNLVNREFYLGLKQFECHFARYDENGFYRKHLDQFKDNSDRQFTLITYLNEPEAGGELRIFKRDHPDEIECDLRPQAGLMVCFLSKQIYHEVLPTTKGRRYSITGWMRTNIP